MRNNDRNNRRSRGSSSRFDPYKGVFYTLILVEIIIKVTFCVCPFFRDNYKVYSRYEFLLLFKDITISFINLVFILNRLFDFISKVFCIFNPLRIINIRNIYETIWVLLQTPLFLYHNNVDTIIILTYICPLLSNFITDKDKPNQI